MAEQQPQESKGWKAQAKGFAVGGAQLALGAAKGAVSKGKEAYSSYKEKKSGEEAEGAMIIEVVFHVEHVNLYRIEPPPAARVKTPIGNGTLRVMKTTGTNGKTLTFLRVGEEGAEGTVDLPLVQSAPVFRLTPWVYVVAGAKGVSHVLELPSTVEEPSLTELDAVLSEACTLRSVELVEEEAGVEDADAVVEAADAAVKEHADQKTIERYEQAAQGVKATSQFVAINLVKGAGVLGRQMHRGAAALKQRLKPNAEPAVVDPKWDDRIGKAKSVTDAAVSVSCAAVKAVDALADVLAREIAAALPARSCEGAHAQGAQVLLRQGADGVVQVYDATMEAIRIVLVDTTAASSDVVEHKYGERAGEVARDSAQVIINARKAAVNVGGLGIKGVGKRVAKKTARELAKDDAEDEGEEDRDTLAESVAVAEGEVAVAVAEAKPPST